MIRYCFIPLLLLASAGRPDSDPLDELGEGLDLTILEREETSPEPEPGVPAHHLFSAFDAAPRVDPPEVREGLHRIQLPAAPYLVAPNPARVDTAYRRMGRAVDQLDLEPAFPLKVVLHADGNVSVGCALQKDVKEALPAGIDISPQPALHLAGVWADVQIAEKTHPLVVRAVVSVRQQAARQDLKLDTSEIYFLPAAPGKVFVGMRIAAP